MVLRTGQGHPTLTARDDLLPIRGVATVLPPPAPRETHDAARPEPQDPPRFGLRTAVVERGVVLLTGPEALKRRGVRR